jgi:hypothetical protein
MPVLSSTQSGLKCLAMVIGTASMVLGSQPGENLLVPSKNYNLYYNISDSNVFGFQPKYESTLTIVSDKTIVNDKTKEEPLIDMVVAKQKMMIKFNKPKKLDFFSIENDEGFIADEI